MTLDVDDYGSVSKEAAIAYGRRQHVVTFDRLGRKQITPNPELAKLDPYDAAKQTQTQITFTENHFTNHIDANGEAGDHYLTPQVAGSNTFELTGARVEGVSERFSFEQWTRSDFELIRCAAEIPYESAVTQ